MEQPLLQEQQRQQLQEPLLAADAGANRSAESEPTPPLIVSVEEDDDAGSQQAAKPRRGQTHWLLTTAVMLSDMFGLGTLSLPADFARLGWLPALGCMAWFAVADVYSGCLYQRLTQRVPQALVFDEIGHAALVRVGSAAVFCTIYLTIAACPIILHLVCVETLRQTFFMLDLSKPLAFWLVTAMIFPLGQVHQMEDVAAVSVIGTLGMLLAMLIVVGKLLAIFLLQPASAVRAPTELVAQGQGFHSQLVGVMDIAFAFGGQINWLRYITTMRQRSKFASAVSITAGFMTGIYLLVACTGYSVFGAAMDLHKPISSVVGQDWWSVAMNAGIFVHCIISYQVNINVVASLALHLTVPKHADELARTNSLPKRGLWALATGCCIAYAGCLAYAFDFFSLVMSLIASLGDVLSMTGLPCLFALHLLAMPRWERGLCWGLFALSCVLSGAGVVSSLQQLLEAWRGGDGSDGGP